MQIDIARRQLLTGAIALGIGASIGRVQAAQPESTAASLELGALPWDAAALAPVISAETISFHYGKHHKGYLDNLVKLIAGTALEGQPLDAIVKAAAGKPEQVAIFNNAAQVWNHDFYWNSLSPKGGGAPGAALRERIEAAFGSVAELRTAFLAASAAQFGSGWVWLAQERSGGKLAVLKTGNADTPLTSATHVPLAVVDVWEHAYYIDYRNRRADYAAAVFDKLLDWGFVERNLG